MKHLTAYIHENMNDNKFVSDLDIIYDKPTKTVTVQGTYMDKGFVGITLTNVSDSDVKEITRLRDTTQIWSTFVNKLSRKYHVSHIK